MVTEKIANHPLIEVVRDEITELPTDTITVVATGPLTSDALAEKFMLLMGGDGFLFLRCGSAHYRRQHRRYEQGLSQVSV